MKKIIFSILLMTFTLGSFAQTSLMSNISGDTLTNTQTKTMVTTATKATGWGSISIQPVFTKVSGTVFGKATLQGSLDGVNYVNTGTGDTLHLSNQTTNTTIWKFTSTPYPYWRITTTTTGTMKVTMLGYIMTKDKKLQ